jgi:hypothetical protein
MLRNFLLVIPLLFGSVAGHAEGIHKCMTSEGVSYQGIPCRGSEVAMPAAPAVATTPVQPMAVQQASFSEGHSVGECASRSRTTPWVPGRREAICVGMPDDQVLNLAGWGRPAKIVRTRAAREWRETWTYDATTAGFRQLQFVNGRLAQVDVEPAYARAESIARMASN